MKIRLLFLCLSFICSRALFAQSFGGNPPSLRWKKIESKSFTIIFPEGLEAVAQRTATIGERILPVTAPTIGDKNRKINVVLQNQMIISNGYVGLAPWRSEFFLTPLPNSLQLGSLNWADLLTLHEVRHVQQFANMRKGFSKFAYYMLGQQGQALANIFAVPNWFFEGDAVYQETLLSEQGRGRLPGFFRTYRAIDDAGLTYTYAQLRNGSLRKLLPDHYSTGYILVSEGRKKFGPDVWKNVADKAARYSTIVYPFQGAFKKMTNQSFQSFVKETLYKDSSTPTIAETRIGTLSDQFVTAYSFPQEAGKDSLIVLKKTGQDIPAFYWVTKEGEKRIRTVDVQVDPAFSYRDGKIAYTSFIPDPRWGNRNYADIVLLDVHANQRKRITHKGKYFAPDIAHNGSSILAVYVAPSGVQSLHVIDASTGKLTHRFSDSTLVYTYPKFAEDDAAIYALVRTHDGLMGIQQINLQTGEASYVLAPSRQPLAFLNEKKGDLYFTAAYQNREKLMKYAVKERKLYQVISRFAGVEQGTPIGGDSVVYAGLTAQGTTLFRAAEETQPISHADWFQTTKSDLGEHSPFLLDSMTVNTLPIKRYRNDANFFNFHSWSIDFIRPEWSITFQGENVMSTVQTEATVLYNEFEDFLKTDFKVSYARWFPWLTAGASYTTNRSAVYNNIPLSWNEWSFNTGISVPLDFTRGRTFHGLRVATEYSLINEIYKNRPKSFDFNLGAIRSEISWSLSSQKANQQIFPSWGFITRIQNQFLVSERRGYQFDWIANAYVPGLKKTHSIVLAAGYQRRDTLNQYIFPNAFPLSRGYPTLSLPRMFNVGVNYHFPIAYPDWGFANLLYFLRIRANIFYDHSYVKNLENRTNWSLNSVGTEIMFDTRFLNQLPLSLGVRVSRLLSKNGPYDEQPKRTFIEFVMPVSF